MVDETKFFFFATSPRQKIVANATSRIAPWKEGRTAHSQSTHLPGAGRRGRATSSLIVVYRELLSARSPTARPRTTKYTVRLVRRLSTQATHALGAPDGCRDDSGARVVAVVAPCRGCGIRRLTSGIAPTEPPRGSFRPRCTRMEW